MRSVLISWHPPEGLSAKAIQAYHVYLNGTLKATIKGSERTKALLEDVDANQVLARFFSWHFYAGSYFVFNSSFIDAYYVYKKST